MVIREALLGENTAENRLKIAQYACKSKENFYELMQCFLCNEYRIAQRAAWIVSQVALEKPSYIKPYIKELVYQLSREGAHAAIIRNSVRILQRIVIPAEYHAEVMNACFGFIESQETPAAIKAFSLTTLDNLSKIYPEIKQELKLIIEERWDIETPAFKARAKRILK